MFATELLFNMLSNSLAAIIRRGADEISLSTMAPNRAADEIYYPRGIKNRPTLLRGPKNLLKSPPGDLENLQDTESLPK